MKILALTRYGRMGASSRLRTFQYIPFLEQQGAVVDVANLLSDDYLRVLYADGGHSRTERLIAYGRRLRAITRSQRYDLIWLEKELFPWLPALGERILGKLATPYVVDYDDAIFHNYDMHPLQLVRKLLGSKIKTVMSQSAFVIAGNQYIAEYAEKAGARKVEVVPTVIDIEKYSYKTKRPEKGSETITIGWIGTPVTFKYLKQLQHVLERFCKLNNARVVAVGAGDQEPWKDDILVVKPWSEQREVQELESFDIGIMPVPTDSAWARGKCGYKLIQYMGCGKPVIASPVGVNKDIVRNGKNGYLAHSHEDWFRSLELLKKSRNDFLTMGSCGRKLVEDNYCIQVTAPRVYHLLRDVLSSKG